jgi:hypothetical protein
MAGLSARQNEVIFAHTRYDYKSYEDYRMLAKISDFKTCFVDEIEFDRYATYIISPVNCEFRDLMNSKGRTKDTPHKCQVIYWQLERPDSGNWLLSSMHGTMVYNQVGEMLSFVDKVWVPHRYTALLDPRAIHVPVGGDPRLRLTEGYSEKKYDVALFAYQCHRRAPVFSELKRRFKVAPDGYDLDRDKILNGSRCMVAVHQTPMPIGEPQRVALAATYRLPFFTETISDPGPLVEGRDFRHAKIEQIPDMVAHWLSQDQSKLGESLFQRLAVEWNFRRCVEDGIERSFP